MSTALLFALWTSLEENEGRSQRRNPEAPRPAVPRHPTWEEGRWSAAFGRITAAGTPPRGRPVIPEQRRPDRAGVPQATAG